MCTPDGEMGGKVIGVLDFPSSYSAVRHAEPKMGPAIEQQLCRFWH
jgi:hypothetical protein